MKLLDQFGRDTTTLRLPDLMGTGIVVNADGGVTAVVELPPRSTDNVSTHTLFQLTSDGASDLRRLIPSGASGQIKIQWRRYSGAEYAREETRPGMTAGQLAYIRLGQERIDKIRFPQRQVLLAVRFAPASESLNREVRRRLLRRGKTAVGLTNRTAEARDQLAATIRRAQSWIGRMAGSSFAAVPACVRQLTWSVRRDLLRTIDWLPDSAVAGPGDIARLAAGAVTPYDDHIEINTPAGTRLLRLLTLTTNAFPTTGLSLPDGTWLRDLDVTRGEDPDDDAIDDDDIDDGISTPDDPTAGPVEVSIRFRNVPTKEAISRMETAITLAKEQGRSASVGVAGEPPEHIQDARATLSARLADVRAGRTGMVEDTVTWVIEAQDMATLDRRTQNAIDYYGNMGIDVWAAPCLQDLLYKELLLSESPRIPEFAQFRPWETLVGGWWHGGSMAGATRGPYLAANCGSTPGPFRCRLSQAQQDGDPVTSVFVGQTGGGKSTALMLAMLSEVIDGAWAALTDLKGDLKGIVPAAEMFGVPVTTVATDTIGSGALDPFLWVPDVDDAVSLVVDNMMMALPFGLAGDNESVLRRYADSVGQRPAGQRSTAAVIDELIAAADADTRALGEKLRLLAKDPLARPVLGRPDPDVATLPLGPGLVYLRYVGMRWPGKDTPREFWKAGHRLTIMLMQAGSAYLMYMAGRVKGRKIVGLTELHLWMRYDFGRETVSELVLMGRALNVNPLLDTQGARQLLLVEDLIPNINQKFCFTVRSPEEADAQAMLLGLEPEPAFRRLQVRHKHTKGVRMCLAQIGEQIAPLQFDYLHEQIAELLQTNPDAADKITEDDEDTTDVDTDDVDYSELQEAIA